jgi:predicted signal transduction protein with EAL and GGDEF domain
MYKAKDLGRNSAKVYDSSMSDDVNRDLELEQDLREAVKNTDQLELYYQAKPANYLVTSPSLSVKCNPESVIFLR